ncbi:MAG TPA: NAD-dependent epimerase/dehydratase family protein [Candidatus Binatia bacterium]|nr:NAD-dependent epimerase/dehydratase family protein [Candidatus Binatia bacterium]
MSPRTLVTGSGGFLGSHLVEGLLGEGFAVRALARPTNVPRWLADRGAELVVGDVTLPEMQAAACQGCEAVVHAASLVTEVAVPDSEYFRVNAEASETLARSAARAGVKRFVFVSSTGVHRPNSGKALDESTPLEPEDVYGGSKAEAERRLTAVAVETGLTLVIVRPSRIYGPRDASLGRVFRAIDRRRFWLVGPCDAEVDFVYVTDVVAGLCRAATQGCGIYLIGGPERVTLERFFTEIAAALGRRLPRLRLPLRPAMLAAAAIARVYTAVGREPPVAPKRFALFRNSRVVDASRARLDLGYAPAVHFREGIARTAAWYRNAGRQ